MQKPNFPLKKYIKAVELIAEKRGLADVKIIKNKGSVVRFELFEKGMTQPSEMWIVHHLHNKKKTIWSKDDYRKAAVRLCVTYDEFLEEIRAA